MTVSAWENAPWMIGGGVEHEVELARLLAYGAFNGREGIVRPEHLKVAPLDIAGAGVKVGIGACAILNRSGTAFAEAYIGRLPVEDDPIAITPTGSGAGRSDLIIARVEDPYQPGNPWPVPPDSAKQTTQYIRTVVIPNVSNTAETLADAGVNFSGIALARIDIPASTSTITAAHIKDVRKMYAANSEPGVDDLVTPSARDDAPQTDTYATWPTALNRQVSIPKWATHAKCRLIIGQAGWGASGNNAGAGWSAVGNIIVRIGTTDGTPVAYNVDADQGATRGTIVAGASALALPASIRGTKQDFRVRANRQNGSTRLFVDEKSILSIELEWLEQPE